MASLANSVSKSWSSTSTWHGIQDFNRSRTSFFRIFWTTTLLLTTAMMIWQLYQVINNYLHSQIYVTTITSIPMESLVFPNVSVCNYNRVNVSRKSALNLSDAALAYLYLALPQNYKISSDTLNNTAELRLAYLSWVRSYNQTVNVEGIFTHLGHDCEATYLACNFGGRPFDCCSNVNTIVNQFGKCLSVVPAQSVVNSWPYPAQVDPGPQGALSLVLDPNLDEYSDVITNDLISEGIILLVTNQPEAYQIDDLISLQPGTVVSVAVSATLSFVTGPKYKVWTLPCTVNATLRFMPGEYTHNKCSLDCYIETIVQYCKCGFWTRSELGYVPCSGDNIACVNALWYSKEEWTFPALDRFRECTLNDCDSPCEERYTFTTRVTQTVMTTAQMSQAQWAYASILTNPYPRMEDLIQVDVYFDSMELTVKETAEKLSIFDLISNIGGQMGLWGGMSVISFVQLSALVLSACRALKNEISVRLYTVYIPKRDKTTSTEITVKPSNEALYRHDRDNQIDTPKTVHGY